MCGIAGIIHRDRDKPIDPQRLNAMAAILHHRGPDGYGRAMRSGVGMAHSRLSIIDLRQSATQPFSSADQKLLLAHNGEFYDFQRIRAGMTARGARFRTKSDSEIVMHLYRERGLSGTLPHLRGEFAFALFDSERDRLHLVRDRFGVKPLYWTRTADSIIWGSEVKALFAYPGVKRAFNAEGVFHQLMQTIVPGSTPYEGIFQVQPGHTLTVDRRDGALHVEEKPYWDMDFPPETDRRELSEKESIEMIRAGLLEAVQHRLVADVPVACYLSGGIDSCSILGLSAAVKQDSVKAFTIGFDNDEYDESTIATEMARSVGADQDIMMLSASHLYDHFVETHWYTERTIYNTLAVAKLLMSRHVQRAGYKVVVTGEGSDELFGGYPAFRMDMFRHGLDHLPLDERREWQRMLEDSNELVRGAMLAEKELHDPALERLCGFTPACLQPWLATGLRVPTVLSGDLRSALSGYSPGSAIAARLNPEQIRDRHPLDKAQYVWIKTQLEGQILTWGGDRVDMANSMEARPAFLDHHLAAKAVQVAPHLRIKGRREKYVLREAMRGLLPQVLYEREKFAFMAPPAHTDQKKLDALRGLSDDYLSSSSIREAGLLDEDGVRQALRAYHDSGTSPTELVQLDALINHMLGVQILHRQFIATDVPADAQKRAQTLGWTDTRNLAEHQG